MRVCPFCGEMIEDHAKACPFCGSDEKTGWKPDFFDEDGIDIDPDCHERESEGWLNPKKQSFTTWIFIVLVLVIVGIFLLRNI